MIDGKSKKTLVKLIASGGLVGWGLSALIGATAVGVLGAGVGGPAGFIFAVSGVIIAFAIYGVVRLIKG